MRKQAAAISLALLLRAASAGASPPDCPPVTAGHSAERALSDQPYERDVPRLCPVEVPDASPHAWATVPGQERADTLRRVGFSVLGAGAAMVVLGAGLAVCGRTQPLGPTRDACRAMALPAAVLGGGLLVGGVAVLGYQAWMVPEPSVGTVGWRGGIEATLAFDLILSAR